MGTQADSLQADLQSMRLALLGGDLCLDFVNTAEHRGTPQRIEFLTSPQRLLAWCRHAALLSDRELERLARAAARDRSQAEALLAQALTLREALYRVFAALVQHQPPTPTALKPLNEALRLVNAQRKLSVQGTGVMWTWAPSGAATASVLGPLCLAAAQLLTSPDLHRLRQCAGCGWFFLDTSRNHTRRWCSMVFCGSKMKSRRQYQRRISGDAAA